MHALMTDLPEKNDEMRVLSFTVAVGELLLSNGGEIFRVQDTMERIAAAFHIPNFHVYVLTNGLFVSIDGNKISSVRAIKNTTTHLGRITAINALSREIVAGKVTLDEAFIRLKQIEQIPYQSYSYRTAACAVGTASFAFLYGGSFLDAVCAFLVGLFLEPFRIFLEKNHTGKVISNFFAAMLVALISILAQTLLFQWNISVHLDKIIVGGIIPLVPGIALTTGIRDIAGGDYLSGLIRGVDALLIGGSIATGVGFVLYLNQFSLWRI